MTAVLARLGIPRLWHEDVDELWPWLRRIGVPVVSLVAPAYSYGVERVPATGGAVLAANHFSAIDHPLLAALFPRPIFFISKAELMEVPLLGDALRWTGVFPVRRGLVDRAALRQARELAASGRVVGVHLEGTRQRSGRPGEFRRGAVVIAQQAGVPVIPCGIDTFGWSPWSRRPSALVFGEPIILADLARGREGYGRALERVADEVVRLWRQAVDVRSTYFPLRLADGARRRSFIRAAEHWPDHADAPRLRYERGCARS